MRQLVVGKIGADADAVGLRIGQRGDTQHPYQHLSSETCEECVALPAEMLEQDRRALVENLFVHKAVFGKTAAKVRRI